MEYQVKQSLLVGAIAGASTVMLYEIFYYFARARGEPMNYDFKFFLGVIIGLVIAAIAGGITFALLRKQ